MSYPIKFRRPVLAVRAKEGLSFDVAASRFSIGVATLKRWSKRIEPSSYKRKSRKIDLAKLHRDVIDHPDSFQYERAKRFSVTQKAIWKALRELGVTYKKSPEASKVGRRQTAHLPQ